jgi:hypothetical protein
MTKSDTLASQNVWPGIENERRRDRLVRKVAVAAWSVTGALVLLLGVAVGLQVALVARAAVAGALPWTAVFGVAMPFIIVLGILSVLIATLATIGVFLRLRTASLADIQLRLAALEEMLSARS